MGPPDLSVYTTAKHEGLDFIFTLLVGYREPPAGFPVREGLYYNPYYPGGVLAMPPPLSVDGQIEYEDGTPCTKSQMAADISNFICWASEPTHDERKLMGLKAFSACLVVWFYPVFGTVRIGLATRRVAST